MSALAETHAAVNLGQGFPDSAGPVEIIEAAVAALRAGHNQYPPVPGIAPLREAVARHQRHWYGIPVDPRSEVVVTAGASEAIAAAVLAFVSPGDEVVVLEPFYDLYRACVSMAGGTLVPVRLHEPGFRFDQAALAAAVTDRTRMLLLNSPHNPTGLVLDEHEVRAVARIAAEHDLLVVADEVYEHMVYDGRRHHPVAAVPGMWERTVSIGSAGKSFSVTGWKVGWATGPADLLSRVQGVKQYLSFAAGTPLQHGVVRALASPDGYYEDLRTDYQRRRDLLADGLAELGFAVSRPAGTYFVTVDAGPLGATDGLRFCRELPRRCGVAAIPNSVFYTDPGAAGAQVRFTFCKPEAVLREGLRRLRRGLRGGW
ncbi:aminotransferase class I/II-fold pyridoxal phosphate-dependent enzyme [Streptomyces sp. NPDC000987]|uniref:aminotransferase class I/II-fold pyridoxal phosphate-dependent enzyme n=1 Tax=Streptomyces sp. NPDC000987 TaxID=3154374 RepID=UPI0033193460